MITTFHESLDLPNDSVSLSSLRSIATPKWMLALILKNVAMADH